MIASLIALDHALLTVVHETMRNGLFDRLMPLLSDARLWAAPLGFACVLAIYIGRRRGVAVLITLVLAVGIGDFTGSLLKHLVGRARPFDGPPTSFPSNHAINTFACAIVVSGIWRRWWVRLTVYGIALAVCFSRVYLAAHYPADVIAGACWGSLIGAGVLALARNRFPNYLNEPASH